MFKRYFSNLKKIMGSKEYKELVMTELSIDIIVGMIFGFFAFLNFRKTRKENPWGYPDSLEEGDIDIDEEL